MTTATTTTIAGLLKGNGATVSAAVAGTDYAAANASTTVNGITCALGGSCTATAAAGTLTGSTLASGVTGSSLTALSTIATGVWQGTIIAPAYGGSGQNNSSSSGVAQWSSGAYSVSTALANSTTATTQAAADNSTKVATTAYVDSKLPQVIGVVNLTAQGANISATTITNASSVAAGIYQASCTVSVTRAATTLSNLPSCYIQCVNGSDGVTKTILTPWNGQNDGANTTATADSYVTSCNAQAGSSIKYFTTAWSSTGATSMQYDLSLVLVRIQ